MKVIKKRSFYTLKIGMPDDTDKDQNFVFATQKVITNRPVFEELEPKTQLFFSIPPPLFFCP